MLMKAVLAAAVLAIGSSAFAATGAASFGSVAGGTVGFSSLGTSTFASGGGGTNFADTITFSGLAASGLYDVWLDFSASKIGTGATAFLQGATSSPVTIAESAFSKRFHLGTLATTQMSNGAGAFVFTFNAPNAVGAHYTGALEVALVPEPGTYALFAAGLAAVGFMVRRRSRQDV